MDRFRTGERGCPALVNEVQGIIGSVVDAAGGAESNNDTGWEWVEDLGVGVAGDTRYQADPVTGDVVPNFRDFRHPTQLSKAEIGGHAFDTESDYFLWGVAHEARHWVTSVKVKDGEVTDEHIGPEWERLEDCFDGTN